MLHENNITLEKIKELSKHIKRCSILAIVTSLLGTIVIGFIYFIFFYHISSHFNVFVERNSELFLRIGGHTASIITISIISPIFAFITIIAMIVIICLGIKLNKIIKNEIIKKAIFLMILGFFVLPIIPIFWSGCIIMLLLSLKLLKENNTKEEKDLQRLSASKNNKLLEKNQNNKLLEKS